MFDKVIYSNLSLVCYDTNVNSVSKVFVGEFNKERIVLQHTVLEQLDMKKKKEEVGEGDREEGEGEERRKGQRGEEKKEEGKGKKKRREKRMEKRKKGNNGKGKESKKNLDTEVKKPFLEK